MEKVAAREMLLSGNRSLKRPTFSECVKSSKSSSCLWAVRPAAALGGALPHGATGAPFFLPRSRGCITCSDLSLCLATMALGKNADTDHNCSDNRSRRHRSLLALLAYSSRLTPLSSSQFEQRRNSQLPHYCYWERAIWHACLSPRGCQITAVIFMVVVLFFCPPLKRTSTWAVAPNVSMQSVVQANQALGADRLAQFRRPWDISGSTSRSASPRSSLCVQLVCTSVTTIPS